MTHLRTSDFDRQKSTFGFLYSKYIFSLKIGILILVNLTWAKRAA